MQGIPSSNPVFPETRSIILNDLSLKNASSKKTSTCAAVLVSGIADMLPKHEPSVSYYLCKGT